MLIIWAFIPKRRGRPGRQLANLGTAVRALLEILGR